jgi:hypothetical protein
VEGDDLTDQDWDVEGGAGGAASGGDGSASPSAPADGRRDGAQRDARSAKVVPFPGNWFGAVEDLVPIYPDPVPIRPNPVPPEPVPREVEPVHSVVGVVPQPNTPPADASDFWEGDAATLQELADTTDAPSSIALLRSPAAASRKSSRRVDADAAAQSGERDDGEVGSPEKAGGRRRRALAIGGLLAAAVIGGGVLALNLLPGAAKSGAVRHPGALGAASARRPQAITDTITASVTVTTKAPRRTHRHHAIRTAGTKTTAAEVSKPTADSGADTASPTSEVSPASTTPPAGSSSGSGGSAASGSGCVQSPDSGCLP